MQRPFDFVVYGASGYTGQYVLEELARRTKDSQFKWAIAGRNENKLNKVLAESSRIIDMDLSSVPVIIADSSDQTSLEAMAKQAVVVLNCVGPYRLYGEPVVDACVKNGTSHVDISGEPIFVESMEAKYHETAKENGVYIVGACGFDSIPVDLGLRYLTDKFKGDLHSVETVVDFHLGPQGYKVNAGTYQTVLLTLKGGGDDMSSIRQQIMPKSVPQIAPAMDARGSLFKHESLNQWCAPADIDGWLLNRSRYHNFYQRNERPFLYRQCVAFKSLCQLICYGLRFALVAILFQCGCFFDFIYNNPDCVTFGFISTKGPSRQQADSTFFTYWFFGKGWASKTSDPLAARSEPPTEHLVVRCDAPDPGYNGTAACLVAAAITIRKDADKMPSTGGVYTPAAAFADTGIFEELAKSRVTYKVV